MKDELGDRMKSFYEDRFRHLLPRRAYTIVRVDGKAFHTYCKRLEKPFDVDLMADMDGAAAYLCKIAQGARFAYVQSDEISVLITDFDTLTTSSWFDSNLQKICSVSASSVTAEFNKLRLVRPDTSPASRGLAMFDARVFQIPCMTEVENYFIWRQNDATRNSISMTAQSMYSAKQLDGKNMSELQEMIHQKGKNWNDMPVGFKRGRVIMKQAYTTENGSTRSKWVSFDPPIFSKDKAFLETLVPDIDKINNDVQVIKKAKTPSGMGMSYMTHKAKTGR